MQTKSYARKEVCTMQTVSRLSVLRPRYSRAAAHTVKLWQKLHAAVPRNMHLQESYLPTTNNPACWQLAAHTAAASSLPTTTFQLPQPPETTELGSLDTCFSVMQQHAVPGTMCPAEVEQQLRALAAAEPDTLFLAVQCGRWLDSAQGVAAGQPARAVVLLRPDIASDRCVLFVTAVKLDQNGWPSGETYPSPSAFERCTTRDRRKYRHTFQVLPAPDTATSEPTSATPQLHRTRYSSLNDWLHVHYGEHPRLAAADIARLEQSSLNSSDGSSFQSRRRKKAIAIGRQLPRLPAVARKTQSGSHRAGVSSCSTRVSVGKSESTASSFANSLTRRADHSNGSWPFCTYTQNWGGLLAQGRAALLAADPDQMTVFIHSVDIKLLTLACDAEIAATRPSTACAVYDVLLEVLEARQGADLASAS